MASKVINTILKLRDEMSGGLVKAAKKTSTVSDEMTRATRKVVAFKNKGVKAITDFAKTTAKVGTGAVAAFGAYSVKVGMDFESQMSKVSAISGASASDVQRLTEAAKEMGATTKFSATESAQALEYMAMAGWKTDQMISGLPGIMNLAAASGEDLASVSDIVTDALTGFGLQAKDSAHFADVLAKASSSSNTNVSLMGETFKYAAPVAGALKYSIEDTAVAVGLMANAGIKGSEAGTALRGVLTNLAKPSDTVAGYMEALGVSLTDSEGNVKPLAAQMVDLRNKFAGLTDAQKAEYAAGIAGKEAMSGLLAIVNASETDFNNLTNAIANSDGTAQAMADTMNNNLQGKITLLKSAVEGVGITFYDSIKDKASSAVQSLTDKISQWQQDGTIDMVAKKVGDGFTTVITKGSQVVSWVVQNKETVIGAIKGIAIAIGTIKFIKLAGDTVNAINTLNLFRQAVWTIAKANIPMLTTAFWKNTAAATANKALLTGIWLKNQAITIATSSAAWVHNTAMLGVNKAGLLAHKAIGGAVWLGTQSKALVLSSAAWVKNTATLAANKTALVASKVATGAMTVGTGALTAAQWALNTAFYATPIGWIVLAVMALVAAGVALYKNWDVVKAKAIELWDKGKEVFGGLKDTIVGAFDYAKEKVSGFFTWIDDKIESVPLLGDLYKGGKSAINFIIDKIGGNALGTSYWQGGLTYINERGGEIVNLPNGTQIIPHDVSLSMARDFNSKIASRTISPANLQKKSASAPNISVYVTVQGNMIGNKEYAKQLGEEVAGEIIKKMENIA